MLTLVLDFKVVCSSPRTPVLCQSHWSCFFELFFFVTTIPRNRDGNSLVVLVGADEAVDGLWLRFVAVSGLRRLVADRLLVDRLVADDGLRLMGHRLVANDSFDEKLGQIFESIIISSIG